MIHVGPVFNQDHKSNEKSQSKSRPDLFRSDSRELATDQTTVLRKALGVPDGSCDGNRGASPAGESTHIATPFTSTGWAPFEFELWQSSGFLKKKGVFLVAVPPGACSTALCTFFAAYLSGQACDSFERCWFPGDVLVSTPSEHVRRAINSAFFQHRPNDGKIKIDVTTRRFNWKAPLINLHDALEGRAKGEMSAIVVDAGSFAQGIDEAIVESAYVVLNEMAEKADCLILLVVESTSRSIDPFERIPRSLRILRGTLLVVPLLPKNAALQLAASPEFLLIRLEETAAIALTVRFRLEKRLLGDVSNICWVEKKFSDPRSAFHSAETAELTRSQEQAVQFALDVIRTKGPVTTSDLKALGQHQGIAQTTMRDAVTAAKLLGYLQSVRQNDGRFYWMIPRLPQLPPQQQWRYPV